MFGDAIFNSGSRGSNFSLLRIGLNVFLTIRLDWVHLFSFGFFGIDFPLKKPAAVASCAGALPCIDHMPATPIRKPNATI